MSKGWETWGTFDGKEAEVSLIIYGDTVKNGLWDVERSKDGKRIWPKLYPDLKNNNSDIRFLGFFTSTAKGDYNDYILDIENQIKKNPKLVSKDGIGPIPKKKMKKIIVEVEDDEEPPF